MHEYQYQVTDGSGPYLPFKTMKGAMALADTLASKPGADPREIMIEVRDVIEIDGKKAYSIWRPV